MLTFSDEYEKVYLWAVLPVRPAHPCPNGDPSRRASKYLLYAIGEIALVVNGITRAALRGIDCSSH